MKKKKGGIYDFFITLPDRLYPFAVEVDGKKVRGRVSYQAQLEMVLEKYGVKRYGYKIMAYRQVCHFLGSILFILSAAIISHILYGSEVALYILLAAAVIAITYQEFYLHPRTYAQHWKKGVLDWMAWTAPIIIFIAASVF